MNGSGSNEALNNNNVVSYKKIMMAKAHIEKADIEKAETENADTEKANIGKADTENAESSNNLNDKKRKNYEEAAKDDSAKTKCQKKRKTSTHEVAPEHKEDLVEEVILILLKLEFHLAYDCVRTLNDEVVLLKLEVRKVLYEYLNK